MNTKVFKIESALDSAQINDAAAILKNGGLVAIPTETVYGLAANAFDSEAVKSIFVAKGRPQDNPLIVHVSCLDEVAPLVKEIDPRLDALAKAFWPGALTVIMKKSSLVPDVVSAGLDTVAIRMPSHPVANAIIAAAGVPLAAPSANTSGRPSPTSAQHVIADLDTKIDAVVDGGRCDIGVESTVITLATEKPRLLRPGGVTPEELEKVLGEIEIDPAVLAELTEGAVAHSPGMKYKHYSPKANVTIVKGSLEDFAQFIARQPKSGLCVLCFNGEGEAFGTTAVEYGAENDCLSQARGLFDALRRVDFLGCKNVYVRCPSTSGVGLAVYNRLLRAAAFNEIDLNKKMPVVGLTGQTGAGKTTVCTILAENGIKIIDGDVLARKAVESESVLQALCAAFGADIIDLDGKLNRRLLAQRAFADEEHRKMLNAATHPEITKLTVEEIRSARFEGEKAVVIDAAALFESPIVPLCDFFAAVIAPVEIRKARIIARDSLTEAQADRRISAQFDDEYYAGKADIVIVNDGEGDLFTKVAPLLEKIGAELND